MKVLVFGGTSGAQYLAKRLAREDNVELVHHCHVHPTTKGEKNYIPLKTTSEGTDQEQRARILDLIDLVPSDLIVTTTLNYQLWDGFRNKVSQENIPTILPEKDVAMLEWSKAIGKELLTAVGVPTPAYSVYSREELFEKFFTIPRPFVLKYDRDWRAGMQTIIIDDSNYQAEYEKLTTSGITKYTPIHGTVVESFTVEEYVPGKREYSYHSLVGKHNWIYLGSARDYKRRFENDIGYNTVGLGAYANVNIDPIVHTYVDKILTKLKERGIEYIGFLYLGIQEGKDGITRVLEINVRPGCPEFTTILPLIEGNLSTQLYNAVTEQELTPLAQSNEAVVTVRLVNKDYCLEKYQQWKHPVLDNVPDDIEIVYGDEWYLLHAVLIAKGKTKEEAADKIHQYLKTVDLGDYTYRTDVGYLD